MAQAISGLRGLRSLSLGGYLLGARGAVALARGLGGLARLECVSLVDHQTGD